MSDGGLPPAGWYEDPTQAGMERWWDGSQWGAETRAIAPPTPAPEPQPFAPPSPPPAPEGPPPAPFGGPIAEYSSPDIGEAGGKKSGCFGISSGVVLALAGVVVLIAVAAIAVVAATGGDDDEVGTGATTTTGTTVTGETTAPDAQSDDAPSDDPADEPADDPADEPATTVPAQTDEPSTGSEADDAVSCSRIAPDAIVLEMVNNSPETSSYFLTIGFFDDAGTRVADESSFLDHLRPGERSIEEYYVFEEAGTVCEVIDVERFAAESDPEELAEISACSIDPEADFFGDFVATVSATNASSETSDYSIDVAFIDPEGVRRGSGSAYIGAVRSGETAPGDVFSTSPFAEDHTCEVVGVIRNAS